MYNIGSDVQVSDRQLHNSHHANNLTRSMVERNIQQKVDLNWNFATAMEGLASEDSASKECQKEMVSHQWQNLMQHGSNDVLAFDKASSLNASLVSPISRTKTALGVSTSSYSSNLSYSRLNYSMASNAGFSSLRPRDIYNSHYLRNSPTPFPSQVPPLASSLSVASGGMKIASLENLKQISGVVLFPEQTTSITTCSGVDRHRDKEPHFEIGTTFPVSAYSETTSGDSNWIQHGGLDENNPSFYHVGARSLLGDNTRLHKYNACFPEQASLRILEDDCTFSGMIIRRPKSSQNELSQYGLKNLQSKQCHQWPCPPPLHFDNSLGNCMCGCMVRHEKCYDEVPAERSSRIYALPSEQLHGIQQQGFCTIQAYKPKDSVLFSHDILYAYLTYKSKLVNASRSLQDFVNYLHLAVCDCQICKCDKFSTLISHFDSCLITNCSICSPVRKSCPVKQIKIGSVCEFPSNKKPSGLGKPKGDLSGHAIDYTAMSFDIEDAQPTPKRMKMENSVVSDDWSLGAVLLSPKQFSETENPVLNSQETSTAVASRNGTADNSECANRKLCFGTTEEHLDLQLPQEGVACENKETVLVNDEMPSSIEPTGKSLLTNNDASDNQKLGNEITSFNSEVRCLGDKQQERECLNTSKVQLDSTFCCKSVNFDGMTNLLEEPPFDQEEEKIKLMSETEHTKIAAKCDPSECTADYPSGMKLKENEAGVSLTDFFTATQIKVHLHSLNPCNKLSAGEESTENRSSSVVDENTCQLCALDGLQFTPPRMYCTFCGVRIKRGSNYYWALDEMDAQSCLCTTCCKKSRGGNILLGGLSFSKANLQKGMNTEQIEEAWVRCDKCGRWQHQICALYNPNLDLEGKLKYICPFCRLAEIAALEHVPLPSAFGAQDLPRTMLSDHIEQRLFRSLEREKKQRTKLLGKSPKDDVPGAADLKVRVVLSVNRQLKVRQQFLDILHGGMYPTEFPYRSKVILLFQKVEEVDVCLFAMYVQEFGSECGQPNQRCLYISYLDSVKYFRPEIKTVAGQALRTFVYHEILIGYLDYCKKHGFTTCYIWACPPLRGDDYILYCHPETQKTPKSDKLGRWYKSMLRKASEEKVVVGYTNFYDYFFVPSGECNCKITAARLPYFDGDFWSGAIENMIQQNEKDGGGKSQRKVKKPMSKRTLKAMRHNDRSVDAKDTLVMQKLGDTILPLKEDFIVVHLQFTCINCREAILSGSRWSCNQCSNFHLCSRCHEVEQNPGGLVKHTYICGEKHILRRIAVSDVAGSTDDKDMILENDLFESRHSFLSFCQKNHYEFGTLRRAKHSTMMILHHLQTMTALTMGTK